jgi:hypothetical protein
LGIRTLSQNPKRQCTLYPSFEPIIYNKISNMKKHLMRIAMFAAIVLAVSFYASAQIYVTVHPERPVIVRPVAPSPVHVWIDEEWEAREGRYVFVGGHWAEPPHPGWAWIPGHWKRGARGEWWVGGHWRRR